MSIFRAVFRCARRATNLSIDETARARAATDESHERALVATLTDYERDVKELLARVRTLLTIHFGNEARPIDGPTFEDEEKLLETTLGELAVLVHGFDS